MTVIIDAMGGDHAPREIVMGSVAAAEEYEIDVVLVGHSDVLSPLVSPSSRVSIHHATDVVGFNEHPALAVRKKPDSSIVVAAQLAKKSPNTALFSAGNTGAVMAAALRSFGRISGVERPGVAAIVPTERTKVVVLDVGANVDCKGSHLVQFAIMGSAYSRFVLGVDRPRVGLLNIGEEEKKGNELSLAAYEGLRNEPSIEFHGNIEPEKLYQGIVDVVVTDGFAGNVFLKSSEAVSNVIQRIIHHELSTTTHLDSSLMNQLQERLSKYSTRNPEYAGAPLLGVEGTCIVAHGRSKAETVKHCVALANRFAASETASFIRRHVTVG